jgi:hypothetical protein
MLGAANNHGASSCGIRTIDGEETSVIRRWRKPNFDLLVGTQGGCGKSPSRQLFPLIAGYITWK